MHLLLVEDDMTIASALVFSLEQEGYQVTLSQTFAQAKSLLCSDKTFDLCLFDITLPDGNGYDLCKITKSQRDTPVIFLTACDDEVNIVMGLDMGGDDYITKPFRIRELSSRIRTVLRRYQKDASAQTILSLSNIRIHTNEAKVFKNNTELSLTALEYRLLLTFAMNKGQVLSRSQLLESIWDISGDFVNDNTLTVYMKRLREKLEDDPSNPLIIKTVRGLGYLAGDYNVEE